MKFIATTIRKRDLNAASPFDSFLNFYNQFLIRLSDMFNKGLRIQEHFSHQVYTTTTQDNLVTFPKTIPQKPLLLLLVHARKNNQTTKEVPTLVTEWALKGNAFHVQLSGLEGVPHTLTFLVL